MTGNQEPLEHRLDPARGIGHRHHCPTWSGTTSFCRLPLAQSAAGMDLAIVGLPADSFVSNRPGTRFGPRAIRQASAIMAWQRPWPHATDPFDALKVCDWGDVVFDYGRPATIASEIEAALRQIHQAGAATLSLGGDHFVSLPCLRAHAARHGPLALVQFDAHSDIWGTPGQEQARFDHGTMMRVAAEAGLVDPGASIQVGLRSSNDDPMDFAQIDARAVHERGISAVAEAVRARVGARPVYLSFDIDCLDPAFAPGTGTPVCGGLASWQALEILRALSGIRLVGMDVVEVSPPFDHAEITALAGATVAVELTCLFAAAPRP